MTEDSSKWDDWATPEMVRALEAVPAVYANRYHVVSYGEHIRITLGESVHGPSSTTFRSAVVLTTADAKELARIITELADEVERRAAVMASQPEEGSGAETE